MPCPWPATSQMRRRAAFADSRSSMRNTSSNPSPDVGGWRELYIRPTICDIFLSSMLSASTPPSCAPRVNTLLLASSCSTGRKRAIRYDGGGSARSVSQCARCCASKLQRSTIRWSPALSARSAAAMQRPREPRTSWLMRRHARQEAGRTACAARMALAMVDFPDPGTPQSTRTSWAVAMVEAVITLDTEWWGTRRCNSSQQRCNSYIV